MKKKPCYRCLLQEANQEMYQKQLKRYIEHLERDIRTAESVYTERLTTCKSCSYLETGTCLACGCYVELRAAVKKSHCPYKKW